MFILLGCWKFLSIFPTIFHGFIQYFYLMGMKINMQFIVLHSMKANLSTEKYLDRVIMFLFIHKLANPFIH